MLLSPLIEKAAVINATGLRYYKVRPKSQLDLQSKIDVTPVIGNALVLQPGFMASALCLVVPMGAARLLLMFSGPR
jgi:glycerol-3-phosphate dehydrogenase